MDIETKGIVITIAVFFINIFLLSSAMKMHTLGLINTFGVFMFIVVAFSITFAIVFIKTKICDEDI